MLMPVEEDEKTEGHIESKRKKKQGKAFFWWEELPSRKWKGEDVEVIQEILRRKRKKENGKWEGKMKKWNIDNENKDKKESEGKEGKKKHNAINKEERRRWIENNSIRSIDLLMIDSSENEDGESL